MLKRPLRALVALSSATLLFACSGSGDDDDTTQESVEASQSPSPSPEAASPTPEATEATPTGTQTAAPATPTPTSGGGLIPSARCAVDGDHTVAWADTTHSKSTDPMYDHVFDKTAVRRMDIRMNPSDYEAMQAELETLLGTFGEGGTLPGGGGEPPGGGGVPPGGGGVPPVAITACEGLSVADACSFQIGSDTLSGTCADSDGTLSCVPDGAGPGTEQGGDTDLIEEDPSFFPVEVEVDGDVWCWVGFRRKGNSTLAISWSQGISKLPFRLDFDEFEDDHPEINNQRFFGFKKMTFGNGYGDDSYLRDVLASEIMEDTGLRSARNSFVRVYLDHGDGPVYHGLYTQMEDPDDAMMDRVFGDDAGNLYKPQGDCANLTCFDEDSFSKESNEDEADFSDVQAMLDALSADRTDAAAWRAGLEQVFDVPTFLKWLATNTTIENWDTYGVMAQNYYLYGDPADSGRLTWLPWDLNLSLMTNDRSPDLFHTSTTDTWPMIRYLLDDPTYMQAYTAYLPQALEGAFEMDTFSARALELQALIAPYVVGEDGEIEGYTHISSEQAFWSAVDGDGGLIDHAQSRHDLVNGAL